MLRALRVHYRKKSLICEEQELLRRFGIDPIMGKENLIWAPMRVKGQHGFDGLENVVNRLIQGKLGSVCIKH